MGKAISDVVGEFTGTTRQAEAAQGAAIAQQTAARQQQELAISAAESPQELSALGQALGAQEQSLARQERLVAAIDPAILEASGQALSLLRGEEAKSLGPLQQQRARQRQQLVNTLRGQLGPGAETSSRGLQALSNFDLETQSLTSGQQSQALGQLFGIAQAGGQQRFGQVAQGFGQVAQGFGRQAQRGLSALQGTAGAVTGAAGAQFVGEQIKGQAQGQLFSSALQLGTTAALGGFGGFGGGGAATAAAPTTFGGTFNPLQNIATGVA